MKFGKQLAAQQIAGWDYVDYKGLKKIINSLAKGRPADAALLAAGLRPPFHLSTGNGVPATHHHDGRPLTSATTQNGPSLLPESGESALLQAHKAAFFFKLERELEKINTFYLQKEAEMKNRMRSLIDKRKVMQSHLAGVLSRDSASFLALHEGLRYFERDLSKLQDYIELNATGFRKILKKWDKRSKSTTKELYLARQVDVQPCFNREVISELSDTAAANMRKLESLCVAKGGEHTVDPAADGILSERKAEMAVANAEAQDDLLSNLENELIAAVRAHDKSRVDAIFANVPSYETIDGELRSQLSRVFWRAAVLEAGQQVRLIDTSGLDYGFIDDINGRTPLIEAAASGDLQLVMLCLEKNVNINHKDVYGKEAIHYAAVIDSQVSEYLLEHGADPNHSDYDGSTPIIHAISAGQPECVRSLLRHGSKPSQVSEAVPPLSLAAKHGYLEIVQILLENGHAIVADTSGFLPQHIAARTGHVDVLEALVRAGAGVDAPDKFANWTPLFHAANEGHLDCVKALLRCGASVAAVDDVGKTAIHHAAWSGHPEIVSTLLKASPRGLRPQQTRSPPLNHDIRKRSAAEMSTESADMEVDVDMIPDLSLPPPALPLRTYGHSYLDGKRSLVQITLGHPTTTSHRTPPIRHLRQDHLTSLKLVITSQQDSFNVPHTVMLPLADEQEVIQLLVDSLDALTLQIEVFPTFGSRLIGKAVCLPFHFSRLKAIDRFTAPILDTHLGIIGEVNFELNFVSHYENVQLAIGGRLETYWKSTTSEPPMKGDLQRIGKAPQDPAYITASSLSGDYVKVVVQVTRDGVPIIYPMWMLPTQPFDLAVSDVTIQQVEALASQTKRGLRDVELPSGSDSHSWFKALSQCIAPLADVFAILPSDIGLNLEIRYPTLSDCNRLQLRNPTEVNFTIDAVLSVVYANTLSSAGSARRLLFSSFSPAACAVLNWKQPNYAVLFASYCGLSRSTPEGQLIPPNRVELDRRCTSIEGAVKFAKANNLLGILLDSNIITQVPSLIESVKESGLLLALFGPNTSTLACIDAYTTSEGVLTAKKSDV